MRVRSIALLGAVLCVAGCLPANDETTEDTGAPPVETDADTSPGDAGPDADVPRDRGVARDATVERDAVTPVDGAPNPDAAVPTDAAPAPDAAPPCPDGQAMDACGVCGGEGPATWYADVDADGLGDARIHVTACESPAGFADNSDDAQPDCATNDTDVCGACGGPGELFWFADQDGDGRGDAERRIVSCTAPRGFVANDDDPEPGCATDDTDICAVCGGPGTRLFYLDADGDGLGVAEAPVEACEAPDGYVENADDPDPRCISNDTDACGRCGGPGLIPAWVDQDLDGLGDPAQAVMVCVLQPGLVRNGDDPEPECPTNDTDLCGVCGGADGAADCADECGGTAFLDLCGLCVGGNTGVEPSVADRDADGVPDACDDCPDVPIERRVIVQWDAIAPFSQQGGPAHGPYTFQLILWPSGEFTFLYDTVEPFGATNTVGYQFDGARGQALGVDSEFAREQPHVHWLRDPDGTVSVDYAPVFEWVDITDLSEPLEMGDDTSQAFALPFAFPFGDHTFDTIYVSSNGFVSFAPIQGAAYQNGPLPTNQVGPAIFPFWDDLNPLQGGSVHAFVAAPACQEDCHGDLGGFAFVDGCGLCVGGNTGLQASQDIDCNGDCDGAAFVNDCGLCVAGTPASSPSRPTCVAPI